MQNSELLVEKGSPFPLGATPDENGVNFAVYAPLAVKVELCLFEQHTEKQIAKVLLPDRTGKVWHGFLPNIKPEQCYGYRVYGENSPAHGLCFDPKKLLLDPYAKKLSKPLNWLPQDYTGDSQRMMAKSIVHQDDFDWQGVASPNLKRQELIIYETHVKGFTQLNPHIPSEYRGKYLGLCQPAIIDYLSSLGVNCIQLMPVASFMPEPYISQKKLTNYWGYNPINFFAPEQRYANADPVVEFKTLIREFHRAGFKVIIDVVYNHTAEAGFDGPTLSFRGFDNQDFYLFENTESGGLDYKVHKNNSGCGNSVNMDTPYVLTMVMDAMRYWVNEMGVDGFRFDLAASLGRENREFHHSAAFFKAVAQDPVLNQVILIAEPWDIGHGGYRLGQFPSQWHECNDKFRDTTRAFWRGEKGVLGDFATRLLGSRDIFPKNYRSIQTSINYVTYHDGFTLHDLVSYNERRNEDNGEQNRDGHGHNLSYNHGVEGETDKPKVIAVRQQHKRNFFLTLLCSQGIPHLLAGDEVNRTQKGNNNAYCQDNEISWLNWQFGQTEQDLLAFVQRAIKIRRRYTLLSNLKLQDDDFYHHSSSHEVNWYRRDGQCKDIHDWLDEDNKCFVLELKYIGQNHQQDHLMLLCNGHSNDKLFEFEDLGWQLLIDTQYPTGMDVTAVYRISNSYLMQARSMAILATHLPEVSTYS